MSLGIGFRDRKYPPLGKKTSNNKGNGNHSTHTRTLTHQSGHVPVETLHLVKLYDYALYVEDVQNEIPVSKITDTIGTLGKTIFATSLKDREGLVRGSNGTI